MANYAEQLKDIARECVALVADDFDVRLDWSLDSLNELDNVCATLLQDGPLPEARIDLWWKLIGAYTGEVIISAYDGRWNFSEGAYAVEVHGLKAYPFTIANRVLSGEPFKSLGSFGRAIPAILERTAQEGDA